MTGSPLVSIIVPFYNRRELLSEALQSISKQSYNCWELIAVDDGSTDGSVEIVEEWLQNHPGKLIRIKHSGMAGKVRNEGVKEASGQWIAFLDSDDLRKPDKLKLQIKAAEESPDINLWHCREIWQRGVKIVSQKSQRHRREGEIFSDALLKCIIGPSTVLIRRELWELTGGFREDLEIAEDYELWLRMTAREAVGYLDTALTVKRAGEWDQLSEKYGQIEIFRIEGLKQLVEEKWFEGAGFPEKQSLSQIELVRKCRIYAMGCRKRGRDSEALSYEKLADL